MSESLKKLKKLRGRGFDELRVRGRQLLAARLERTGRSGLARTPTDETLFGLMDAAHIDQPSAESLLSHFRKRRTHNFFAAFADREKTIAELRRRFGKQAEDRVVERASRVCEGHFDLLGFRGLQFGSVPDFHLEPLSGKRSPVTHWSQIDELGTTLTGDKKIVWELNRQQYLCTLGRAYWYTGDEIYAQTAVAHLTAWMDQNPPKMGVNWASSLEVSFRAISWLWALHFFKDSPALTAAVYLRALKFLYLHARHLETYLSTYASPNTHLTGEALGLFYLGTVLPQFRRSSRWRDTGARIMIEELARQVRPDGVYFEQSSYYHRYTTDFYTHLYILARENGQDMEASLAEKLSALLDHLMYITRPDGTTPFFGDDDGGRLVQLDERAPNDFRATLSTASILFARPDYKYVAGEAAEETLWLLGPEAPQAFDRLQAHAPLTTSRAFKDGGYYVMRDGWTKESNYLLVSCGPHGALNCGHSHADALSVDVSARGRTLLVDPGTYTYTGSKEWRDAFRGTAAHNTLTVDDESSSVPDGPFTWRRIAEGRARAWMSHERFDYFEGTHDGYERLSRPATHERSILFLKGDYWILRDRVLTEGAHRYDLRFHFAPDSNPFIESPDTAVAVAAVREHERNAPGLDLVAFGPGGEWRTEQSWVSRCYGERTTAPLCVFSSASIGPTDGPSPGASNSVEFTTFLIPRAVGEGRAASSSEVREVEAEGGKAFEFMKADARDLLLLTTAGPMVEALEVSSDFQCTWLRFERETGELREMVLLGGRALSIDGRKVFEAAESAGYVVARRFGRELRVETNVSGAFTIASFGAGQAVIGEQSYCLSGEAVLHFADGRWRSENSSGQREPETLM
jgi:hypothetical protein